ncbi:GNAT family N-acetyltransferase [Duganella sp. FT135W]|uniref:GNAT family N-acetyltransferase n=1 Tax=Duganella flavida TaxID=2692175 RepID=A0A6L8KHF9_9BURK|nr:GNAT family N-acetyltransferase [Duganella flavida]MYM26177.1 GNAT family N-acetyltransferase [Duganella flavida]
MKIEKLSLAGFAGFLDYLNDHLSDNGHSDTAYFQPLPRTESRFPVEKAEAFISGMQIEVGQPGWRRAWVMREDDDSIAGHIDLRGHPERYTGHRCLLGMGVDRKHRGQGLGKQLIAHAEQWVLLAGVQWVDLQVLSVNAPAIHLYQSCGYRQTGEIPNMFHIDGKYFSYTSMTKRLR